MQNNSAIVSRLRALGPKPKVEGLMCVVPDINKLFAGGVVLDGFVHDQFVGAVIGILMRRN